jgi:ABC-2 type transport system ATP-binding protein
LANHNVDWLLGTTLSGTLRLSVDGTGLPYEVDLDMTDPDAQRIAAKVAKRKMLGSSFSFRAIEDAWSTTDQGFTLLRPSSGHALIDGNDVVSNPASARRHIGVVFQNPSLDKKLTLLENLIHQGHLHGLRGDELKRRAADALAVFHLSDRANDTVETLSGGLARRGEIAKGLLHNPSVLLMDEPSTGLDPGARRDLWDHLLALKKRGLAILLTTHLIEEADRCDRLAILNHGKIVAAGTPDELKKKIGGDVISIQTAEAEALVTGIKSRFQLSPIVLNDVVRLEKEDGHKFIPQLVEAFPGLIRSITVGKPTLEDVFVHETGHRLWDDDGGVNS